MELKLTKNIVSIIVFVHYLVLQCIVYFVIALSTVCILLVS